MPRLQNGRALRPGDYLRVAAGRISARGIRPGEDYARIEHVEHINAPAFLDPDSASAHNRRAARIIVAVFCQGLPGPVLLRPGDQPYGGAVGADRVQADEQQPWWPVEHPPVFADSTVPEALRHRAAATRTLELPVTGIPGPAGLPGTVFAKPADSLMTGDYVQIHAARFPESDMDTDEGFHHVEWVGHLRGPALSALLRDPAWAAGTLTLANVCGLPGMLLLPQSSVNVLAHPNPERRLKDELDPWVEAPTFDFAHVIKPDRAAQRRVDASLRPAPAPDEVGRYPSLYEDPRQRALARDGISAVRPVSTALLPWPHHLFKCAYAGRARQLIRAYTVEGEQAAHAELFTQLHPDGFAACPYHQGDWPAISALVLAFHQAQADGDKARAARARAAMSALSPRDEKWATEWLKDHLWWDSDDEQLTNGQHRLCALRAAGVPVVPVYGRHLPDEDETQPVVPPFEHARRSIETFWRDRLTRRGVPGAWTGASARLLARYPQLRRIAFRSRG